MEKEIEYCYKCGTRIFKSIRCSCFKGNPKYNAPIKIKSIATPLNNHTRYKKDPGFTMTKPWLNLKKEILQIYGCKCMKCGVTGKMHVDHIKPKSKFSKLKLNPKNLQVLCPICNTSKSNIGTTDYRTNEQKQLLTKLRHKYKYINKYWPKSNKIQNKIDARQKKRAAIEKARLERIAAKPKIILKKRANSDPFNSVC